MLVLNLFTEACNCSGGPNAQSGGIHRKESPTVYSDLADRIDTPLYGSSRCLFQPAVHIRADDWLR